MTSTSPCKFLRAKNAYGSLEGGGSPFSIADAGSVFYRCVCTGSPVGPDEQPAYVQNCTPTRKCFTPSERDI